MSPRPRRAHNGAERLAKFSDAVSRAWLYREPAQRAEILACRTRVPASPKRLVPVAHTGLFQRHLLHVRHPGGWSIPSGKVVRCDKLGHDLGPRPRVVRRNQFP